MKRRAPFIASFACLVVAGALALVAADVVRWRDALAADDVRYRAAPAAADLWSTTTFAPGGVARSILDVDDDLAYRRAVRAMRLSRFDESSDSDPELVLRQTEAESMLEALAEAGGPPERQSRAMTLLAVFRLGLRAASPEERAVALRSAIASLQQAIALDTTNDEAKYNLEVALRRSRGVQQVQGGPAPNPAAGAGSKGAATGPPGSGY